jgi:hypothetical protein
MRPTRHLEARNDVAVCPKRCLDLLKADTAAGALRPPLIFCRHVG